MTLAEIRAPSCALFLDFDATAVDIAPAPEPPLSAREPVFIGSVLSDEAGRSTVRHLGGPGRKAGAGTAVDWRRLGGPARLRNERQRIIQARSHDEGPR